MNRGLIPDYITGLPVEIFALAIRERKLALGISQKHGHAIRMRMHGRFFHRDRSALSALGPDRSRKPPCNVSHPPLPRPAPADSPQRPPTRRLLQLTIGLDSSRFLRLFCHVLRGWFACYFLVR